MNTHDLLVPRTVRLICAGLAWLITTTLFVSVALGLTGEEGSALMAKATTVPIAPTVDAPRGNA